VWGLRFDPGTLENLTGFAGTATTAGERLRPIGLK
jgi:hypothetical protein